jgi:hypothetical protein
MRTAIIFLAAVAIVAACDSDQRVAGPAKSQSAVSGSASAAQLAYPPGPSAQSKPGPTAFTQVTTVTTPDIEVQGAAQGFATCPAGTTLIGGGFSFTNEGNPNAQPMVRYSQPSGNSWNVGVANFATGAWYTVFKAYALCAS